MDYLKESLRLHEKLKGKVEILSKVPLRNKDDLSLYYTPGVAAPCLEIEKDPLKSFTLTARGNTVAVISDGSAVLGLGDIGPEASMPVMEGKCVLFKAFGNIDAIPLCLRTKDVDDIVRTVSLLAGSFGGINLEDISAPRCFEIEERLKAICDIPVFHDDQHGTAIVVLAGLINALKVTNREMGNLKVVVNGAGSAGIAISNLLLKVNIGDIILCDKDGVLDENRDDINPYQKEIAMKTNRKKIRGGLREALKGSHIFIGVSAPNIVTREMIKSMNKDPIIFAMANPIPEIMPDVAKEAGAMVVGTGRSDFPNQINNVLAFPGVFRGVLDINGKNISEDMKIAAAYGLANVLEDDELSVDKVLPMAFDPRVCKAVSEAVKKQCK